MSYKFQDMFLWLFGIYYFIPTKQKWVHFLKILALLQQVSRMIKGFMTLLNVSFTSFSLLGMREREWVLLELFINVWNQQRLLFVPSEQKK
jgi:hypothetical protein